MSVRTASCSCGQLVATVTSDPFVYPFATVSLVSAGPAVFLASKRVSQLTRYASRAPRRNICASVTTVAKFGSISVQLAVRPFTTRSMATRD